MYTFFEQIKYKYLKFRYSHKDAFSFRDMRHHTTYCLINYIYNFLQVFEF